MKPKVRVLPSFSAQELDQQLNTQRRSVDFDTFDIQFQQLINSIEDGQIWAAPAYQRKFRWDDKRCSQLIESLLLGIPIPSLFMATNPDNTWEVVDGLQRLSSIVKFAGNAELRSKLKVKDALVLTGLEKLAQFNNLGYNDLPKNIQLHLKTRPLKVITLNDKSDKVVRYDLFERLNTGGVKLSEQEIRDCVYQGEFANFLEMLAAMPEFTKVVRLTDTQKRDGTAEECVLRFFAFFERYMQFDHIVRDFLNQYMGDASKKFDHQNLDKIFRQTFAELAKVFPDGIHRPERKSTTPLNLFEGIAVGAALAISEKGRLVTKNMDTWLASPTLRKHTMAATNNRSAVRGRINFCHERFLGKPEPVTFE